MTKVQVLLSLETVEKLKQDVLVYGMAVVEVTMTAKGKKIIEIQRVQPQAVKLRPEPSEAI